MQLPPACIRALCASQRHLKAFGLDACLRPRGGMGSEQLKEEGVLPGPLVPTHQEEAPGTPASPSVVTPAQVQAAGLQPLAGQAHMVLGANALRQLEVLSTSGMRGRLELQSLMSLLFPSVIHVQLQWLASHRWLTVSGLTLAPA
jgi:hypothetical protein